jgi:hypothetical protein
MKVIIAGSRSLKNFDLIQKAVDFSGFRDIITEVVSGCASGIDSLAITWANHNKIPVKKMPADWDNLKGVPAHQIKTNSAGKKYNVKAGYDRNTAMAKYADALIAILAPGGSPGTENMIETAQNLGLKVSVYEV